jgi:exodeoxyribonuclease-5
MFKDNVVFSDDQHSAIGAFISFLIDPLEKEMLLTGFGGTGKSTIIREFIKIARQQCPTLKILCNIDDKTNIQLTSTTNKAAKVLADATGEEATTIHNLIGLIVVNDFKTGRTKLKKTDRTSVIKDSIIVIDEMSMCNLDLLTTIREHTENCKILWVGDHYQLAPVFENECPVVKQVSNVATLSTIHRQGDNTGIITLANTFRETQDTKIFTPIIPDNITTFHCSGSRFKKEIIRAFTKEMNEDSARVLAWTNRRVHQYNDFIRESMGRTKSFEIGEKVLTNKPITNRNKIVMRTDTTASIDDIYPGVEEGIKGWKIYLSNNVEVFQPEDRIEVDNKIKQLAKNKDWPNYFEAKEFFGDLRPIYASTCQKAQGSSYDEVFIDLDDIGRNRKDTEIARLMYVAISRAREKVFMVGNLPERLYRNYE